MRTNPIFFNMCKKSSRIIFFLIFLIPKHYFKCTFPTLIWFRPSIRPLKYPDPYYDNMKSHKLKSCWNDHLFLKSKESWKNLRFSIISLSRLMLHQHCQSIIIKINSFSSEKHLFLCFKWKKIKRRLSFLRLGKTRISWKCRLKTKPLLFSLLSVN